jgi:cellulose synthase/poly-beta-1,6-N-acetylglucosamine synthase-like glycosyltransferase
MYTARKKVLGVPHHAKAGNINNALLKAPGSGDFVLVLDCDMILHPDFLMRTMGHFYWQPNSPAHNGCGLASVAPAAASPGAVHGQWVLKDKAAFVQTPQVRESQALRLHFTQRTFQLRATCLVSDTA